jgi:ABC-type lipoprotein release transport system permease subunit
MLIIKIAFRNIFRQKRRSFLTLLTMVSGFIMANLALSINLGTYGNIIEDFTRNKTGHVKVNHREYRESPSIYKTIDSSNNIMRRLENNSLISHATPAIFGGGLAAVHDKSFPVTVRAVDPRREDAAFNLSEEITAGDYFSSKGSREVILGKKLAHRLSAESGDTLYLFSQTAYGRMAEDIFTVRGIISPEDTRTSQSLLLMPLETAQEYYELNNRIHEISLVAKQDGVSRKIAQQIQTLLPDRYTALPWQKFNSAFYEAMRADQDGAWVTIIIILIIVGFGILNTVLMAVLERQREYGILKAVGTTPTQIFVLIILEMGMLFLLSLVLSLPLAVAGNYYLAVEGIPLKEPFSYGGIVWNHIYAGFVPESFIIPALVVGIITLCVSFFPALKAARTNPAVTMRID